MEDIERRLAAAAEAAREYELTEQRCAELARRIDELAGRLESLRSVHADEERDVARLEGLSLTRVLASLRGARGDRLARERAEADAARYRVAEAEARLAAVRGEHEVALARLRDLAGAPATFAAVLDEKEQRLTGSADPRGGQLLALAEEQGRLHGELREIQQALRAAATAREALHRLREQLDSAHTWSTYDTFFDGGMVGSMVKRSRLDDAAEAAAYADQCLAVLRSELADVAQVGTHRPTVAVDGVTRFVDVWFDNVFTDFSVHNRLNEARENVARSSRTVDDLRTRLETRADRVRHRLARLESDRRDLLT